jgi:regulator of sigma D
MSTIGYIKNSLGKQLLERREYSLFNKVVVIIKDPLPKDINMTSVIRQVEKRLPYQLAINLDSIYVGEFSELDQREVESVYLDGAIFISNRQENEEMMASSIVHEIAHSLEEQFGEGIYGDSEIIDEFIAKRKKLMELLEAQGIIYPDKRAYLNTDFDEKLDDFFYREVGYELLNRITSGLFLTAYACTSLREYFSNGFEHYFMGENHYLKRISPKLYSKINALTKEI